MVQMTFLRPPLNCPAQVHAIWYPTFWYFSGSTLAGPFETFGLFYGPLAPFGGLWPLPVPKLCETAWKLHKIVWGSVWMCVKLFPLNFSAGVHAFWYPTCWNWPKNGWYSQNCVILRENCVKLRETQNTACLCQAGSKYISNSPIGLNTAEKSLWTEGNTHTHASVLYIRII